MPINYSTVVDPLLGDLRNAVIELAEIMPGDRVLDVCCGTGDQVFHYVRKGAVATGVDRDPGMIELAEKEARRQGFHNINFRPGSAAELPFPDGYFDCASISLALHEMNRDERSQVVAEMKRVVKRAGSLIFVDFNVPLPKNLVAGLINAVELLAGKDNYRCFRDYLAQGGLKQLLKENRLTMQKEALYKRGNVHIIKAGNPV
jgi:ubiquinone/menaquinone biosynthesis C-methylase UbiE